MVESIRYPVSPGLQAEMQVHAKARHADLETLVRRHPDVSDFLRATTPSTAEWNRFREFISDLPQSARVMDVGCGSGPTSFLLAECGREVVCIEPSQEMCERIEAVAAAYALPIQAVAVAAEYLDRADVGTFDACVFKASLHHCDDPDAALRCCYDRLKPGGLLFLLDEPHLRRWRTKAWFQRRLDAGLVPGHYGGNEHIYYRHEYLQMIRRAGFEVERACLAARYLGCSPAYLEQFGKRRLAGAVRRVFYRSVQFLARNGFVGNAVVAALNGLSMLQLDYVARKPA